MTQNIFKVRCVLCVCVLGGPEGVLQTISSRRDIFITHVFLTSLYYGLMALCCSNPEPKNNRASSHPVIMVMLSNVLTESKHIS